MPPPNFENVYATFLYATLIIYVVQKETQIQEGILTFLAHFLMTQKFFMIRLFMPPSKKMKSLCHPPFMPPTKSLCHHFYATLGVA